MDKLIWILFVFACCSFVENGRGSKLNANSWNISIGKKEILSSQKNKKGDLALISKNVFGKNDTLTVNEFWCGYDESNSQTILILKNEEGEELIRNKQEGRGIYATLPFSALLTVKDFTDGKPVSIFLTVIDSTQNINRTFIVGKLKLKL